MDERIGAGSDAVQQGGCEPDDSRHDTEQDEGGKEAQAQRANGQDPGASGGLGRPTRRLQACVGSDAADGGCDRGPSITSTRQRPRRAVRCW